MASVYWCAQGGDVALKISSGRAVIVNASHVSAQSSVLRTALELKSSETVQLDGKTYPLHDISALGSEQRLSQVLMQLAGVTVFQFTKLRKDDMLVGLRPAKLSSISCPL